MPALDAPNSVRTPRLRLVPVTLEMVRLERSDRSAFSARLGAAVPENWPPEILADALDFFEQLLVEHPDWYVWLIWYAILVDEAVLAGSAGFKGPPEAGQVEIGYSVLPQFQRRGYAVEMGRGLVEWAFQQPGVEAILAEAADDNFPSQAVLSRLGFTRLGHGSEPGHSLYRRAGSS